VLMRPARWSQVVSRTITNVGCRKAAKSNFNTIFRSKAPQ